MRRRLTRPSNSGLDVLVVCTANICRSPYIASILSKARPDLAVGSAGTSALVGSPVDPRIADILHAKGIDLGTEATAQAMTARLARSATMIVTATHQHRLQVVATDRSADGRTFTLKELARLSDQLPGGVGLTAVVAGVAQALSTPSDRDYDDDLDDPYGADEAAYDRMVREADDALGRVLRVL